MELKQTAYAILGILAIQSGQSGYEVRRTVKDSVGYFWGESYGQIYPALKTLAAEGLITEETAAGSGRRVRRNYSITTAGRARLAAWLAEPYRENPPRDEFLLKLFFAFDAAPGAAAAQIRAYRERVRKMLAALLDIEKRAKASNAAMPGFPYWMLTLSFGLEQLRSALAWSETAVRTVEELDRANRDKQMDGPAGAMSRFVAEWLATDGNERSGQNEQEQG
jgi:DNA-binding PadR family transcriptional regulator